MIPFWQNQRYCYFAIRCVLIKLMFVVFKDVLQNNTLFFFSSLRADYFFTQIYLYF